MDNIIKAVKSRVYWEFGLLMKCVGKTIENEAKEQKVRLKRWRKAIRYIRC